MEGKRDYKLIIEWPLGENIYWHLFRKGEFVCATESERKFIKKELLYLASKL